MKQLTAVDFFCGMGGVSKGLEMAGYKVLKAYDNWKDALTTHKYNLPDVETEDIDITKLNTKDIPNADLYHFSPPCQSFSTIGKKEGINSQNGQLIYETIRILADKQPRAFTLENVKGLTIGKNKALFLDLIQQYNNIGYLCYWQILNSYNYNVVQNRERVFIVGIRKDIGLQYQFPKPMPNNNKLIDIIGNIRCNQGVKQHGEGLINKLRHIPPGGNVMDIPEHIRPKAFKNSYQRLRWDDIPPTITRNYNMPSSANCVHPEEHRGLSDTEALLIQGFAENWTVLGKQKNLQIGNAVPPPLMQAIAESIKVILDTN